MEEYSCGSDGTVRELAQRLSEAEAGGGGVSRPIRCGEEDL